VLTVFSTLTTLGRIFETPLVSRYIYPDCVLMALYGVQLARGVRPSRAIQLGLAVLAFLAVLSNVGVLRSAGEYLRQTGENTNADVAALDLGRGVIPSGYIATRLPDYPFVAMTAGSYFAAQDALGTPADSIAQLAGASAGAQTTADAELIGEQAILLSPGTSSASAGGTAPAVVTITAGSTTDAASCRRFTPSPALAPGEKSSIEISLAPGAVRVTAGGGPVTVSAQRFGPTAVALGTIGPGRSAIVLVRRDAAPQPWKLTLAGDVPVRACTLS
jgi:hypothetical protein